MKLEYDYDAVNIFDVFVQPQNLQPLKEAMKTECPVAVLNELLRLDREKQLPSLSDSSDSYMKIVSEAATTDVVGKFQLTFSPDDNAEDAITKYLLFSVSDKTWYTIQLYIDIKTPSYNEFYLSS